MKRDKPISERMTEQERIEYKDSVRRGAAITKLQAEPEWEVVADVALQLMEHWKRQLIKINHAHTLEKIAMDRVIWTSMVSGVETLFKQLQDDAEAYKEDLTDEEPPLKSKAKDINPYRSKPE